MRIRIALAVAALAVPAAAGVASADVTNNPTTNDSQGYCTANHIHNFNGDNNGVGHIRSEQKGGNRAAANPPAICETSQGQFAPISNNG